jgi:hypothetical protein
VIVHVNRQRQAVRSGAALHQHLLRFVIHDPFLPVRY